MEPKSIRVIITITERGDVSVQIKQLTAIVYYRVRSGIRSWACQQRRHEHQLQCSYDLNHPSRENHRCDACLQSFFPGLQKSKQAMAANAMRKWGEQHLAFLEREGESDYVDY